MQYWVAVAGLKLFWRDKLGKSDCQYYFNLAFSCPFPALYFSCEVYTYRLINLEL
jgi:hypothetical protein